MYSLLFYVKCALIDLGHNKKLHDWTTELITTGDRSEFIKKSY